MPTNEIRESGRVQYICSWQGSGKAACKDHTRKRAFLQRTNFYSKFCGIDHLDVELGVWYLPAVIWLITSFPHNSQLGIAYQRLIITLPSSIAQLRWSIFSLVLPMFEETPASSTCCNRVQSLPGTKDCHSTNLLDKEQARLQNAGLGTLRSGKQQREAKDSHEIKTTPLATKYTDAHTRTGIEHFYH